MMGGDKMGVEFSNSSLINIFTGEIAGYGGNVTRASSRLTLGNDSWVRYVKSYSATENTLKTSNILNIVEATIGDTNITSRYNFNIKVIIRVQYYESVENTDGTISYSDGTVRVYGISPYFSSETDGKIEEYTLDLENKLIKELEVYIHNTTGSEIDIVKWGLFQSLTVNESLGNSLAIECTLLGVDETSNPDYLSIQFTTGELRLYALKSTETNKFAGYNVNNELVIYWK